MPALPSIDLPVRYAVLRAGERWPDATLSGLVAAPNGDLSLRRVPRIAPAVNMPWGTAAPSGLTVNSTCGLYVADTVSNAVLRIDLACGDRERVGGQSVDGRPGAVAPGPFDQPAGLVIGPYGWLYVADSGSGRILVLGPPELSVRDAWAAGNPGSRPVAIAADERHLFVLDAIAATITVFDPFGVADGAVSLAIQNGLVGAHPAGLAVAGGMVFVSDTATGSVLCFATSDGAAMGVLMSGVAPGALATDGTDLYMADTATGRIAVHLLDGTRLGDVAGFRGPVSALAVGPDGTLFVKGDGGPTYLAAPANAAFIGMGTLTAGPLDAGYDNTWRKAGVHAHGAGLDTVTLETAVDGSPGATPAWKAAGALETLLADPNQPSLPSERYLWLRVTMTTRDPEVSPILLAVEAETPGDGYLRYLPAVYGRDPAQADFLDQFLELGRSELGGLEEAIGGLPRLDDPDIAPADALAWLASWLAFPLPPAMVGGADPSGLRSLLERLHDIDERRGTPAGLRDLVEIYSGARPVIVESLHSQQAWILDRTTVLDFETVLAANAVDGIVVGDDEVGFARPRPAEAWAADLFADSAHRFTVVVPAASTPTEASRALARSVIEAEKPAHTAFHLCFVEPRLRIGVQARLGIDAIVAGDGPLLELDGGDSVLNTGARLAGPPPGPAAAGRRDRLGVDTRVG